MPPSPSLAVSALSSAFLGSAGVGVWREGAPSALLPPSPSTRGLPGTQPPRLPRRSSLPQPSLLSSPLFAQHPLLPHPPCTSPLGSPAPRLASRLPRSAGRQLRARSVSPPPRAAHPSAMAAGSQQASMHYADALWQEEQQVLDGYRALLAGMKADTRAGSRLHTSAHRALFLRESSASGQLALADRESRSQRWDEDEREACDAGGLGQWPIDGKIGQRRRGRSGSRSTPTGWTGRLGASTPLLIKGHSQSPGAGGLGRPFSPAPPVGSEARRGRAGLASAESEARSHAQRSLHFHAHVAGAESDSRRPY